MCFGLTHCTKSAPLSKIDELSPLLGLALLARSPPSPLAAFRSLRRHSSPSRLTLCGAAETAPLATASRTSSPAEKAPNGGRGKD